MIVPIIIGFIWGINMVFDYSSPEEQIVGKLDSKISFKNGFPAFAVKHDPHIQTIKENYFYSQHYGKLSPEESVSAQVYKGFLGFKWTPYVILTRYSNMDAFLAQLKSEQDLNSVDIKFLKSKSELSEASKAKYTDLTNKWIKECDALGGYYCRLKSYLIDNKEEQIKLLRMGCKDKDYHSCYGIFLMNMKSGANVNDIVTQSLRDCESGTLSQCFYHAEYLVYGSKNTADAVKYYTKACEIDYMWSCAKVVQYQK